MPRVTSRRVETPELQGEGSYVVFRKLSHGASKHARRFMVIGDVRNRTDLTIDEIDKLIKEEEELTIKLLTTGIIEWNWQDENGKDLSIPKTSEELDHFTDDELRFLSNCCVGLYPELIEQQLTETKAKN